MDINKKEILNLFNQRKYDQVILKIKDDILDIDLMFLKAICYAFINDFDSADNYIKKHESILAKDFVKLLDTHFNIYFYFKKYDDALTLLEHYEEYPYISQEVEEKYQQLKKTILDKNKSANKNLNKEDIINLLTSKNDEKILRAITLIKDYKPEVFISYLQDIMLDDELKDSIKTSTLLYLCENNFNENIKFNLRGEILTIIPSKLEPIYKNKKYESLMQKSNDILNVQFQELFRSLLTLFFLYYYPLPIPDEIGVDDLYEALTAVCNDYLSFNKIDDINNENIKQLALKIKHISSKY